jgi:hypothetical protein
VQCSCGGELEQGFVPDFSAAAVWSMVWVAGEPSPDKSFWEAFRTGPGLRVENLDARVIEAHRCTSCGRLELYANRRPDPAESPAR